MANIAKTDIDVTVNDRWLEGRKRYCDVTLSINALGSKTYGTTGIPLPTHEKFGMRRNLDSLKIYWGNVGGYVWEFEANSVDAPKLHCLVMANHAPSGNIALNASGNHSHDIALVANAALDANFGMTVTPAFGKNTAGAANVAGNNAGGIQNAGNFVPTGNFTGSGTGQAVLAEYGNAAMANQTLRGVAVGW